VVVESACRCKRDAANCRYAMASDAVLLFRNPLSSLPRTLVTKIIKREETCFFLDVAVRDEA